MMRIFMAEDNICAQSLLKLVSHGNAVVAEILRLKDHIPDAYLLQSKELQQKYQDVIMDFSYFRISDSQEKKIASNLKLQDLDEDLKEKYLEIITRFYLLFENIYQYVIDLNQFVSQLNDNFFIQQNIDTILKDVEGKQLLCESLYLYGSMLLLCDLYIPGAARERLLLAFYRYSTAQSQSNIDEVCKLLRNTGYNQTHGKRPNDYPVEYFGRIPLNYDLIERVIGKLSSEDVYNQLAIYSAPEHRAAALAQQASMLFVCLFFLPQYLNSETTKMREIVDKFFPSNWVVSVYMGVNINVLDYWEPFKAAKTALSNTCNAKLVKEVYTKRGAALPGLTDKMHQLLKEGALTDDYVLDNLNNILNLIIDSNFALRWLLLHSNQVTFFENNKKSKQMREQVQKDANYEPVKVLELLISTAELELKVREILNRLLEKRDENWKTNKNIALEAVNGLSELFSGSKPVSKIPQNEQLKLWFDNIAKQLTALDTISPKAMKRITQIIQALEEVEDFHGMKGTGAIVQYLNESKEALKDCLRGGSLREEQLVALEAAADVSYAWCIADAFTGYLRDSVREDPAIVSRLRALFLKLASAMEIPLLRINQARSDDLVSVSQYYSSELIKYIQKVLQIIPEMVFSIVEKIIELQTWVMKEVPTRLEKDRLREFAQLEQRMQVARLTHSASTFTSGILDMRSTLIGVIKVDPAELLEEGLLKELASHLTKKFEEHLEPQTKRSQPQTTNFLQRLQKLAESMDGYKRSLEYIQDYINMHGLKIWQKQVSAIINESVSREISARKGVALHSPSAGFMGSLARQLAALVDARSTTYVNISSAWFDTKTQTEVVNTKTFSKLYEAIGVVGLHGLDSLYAFMIKNQLQMFMQLYTKNREYLNVGNTDFVDVKEIDQLIAKGAKVHQQLVDAVVTIGTLQILRKHISYQLNTIAKFDSAHLEASLRTMNESLLNLMRQTSTQTEQPKVTTEVLYNLEEFLTRCGIYEPYEKIYMKNVTVIENSDSNTALALLLLAQGHKMQVCVTTGDIITKKSGDNIDGYPLLIGVYTILRQASNCDVDGFVEFLCGYVKAATMLKSKMPEYGNETSYIVRILELFCEIFNYPFQKLEDKLPIAVISHITIK